MMSTRFRDDLNRGWYRPVRHRLGEGVNVWGSKLNECADRLDCLANEITPAVAEVLRELFEEVGQQTKDQFSAVHEAMGGRPALSVDI